MWMWVIRPHLHFSFNLDNAWNCCQSQLNCLSLEVNKGKGALYMARTGPTCHHIRTPMCCSLSHTAFACMSCSPFAEALSRFRGLPSFLHSAVVCQGLGQQLLLTSTPSYCLGTPAQTGPPTKGTCIKPRFWWKPGWNAACDIIFSGRVCIITKGQIQWQA